MRSKMCGGHISRLKHEELKMCGAEQSSSPDSSVTPATAKGDWCLRPSVSVWITARVSFINKRYWFAGAVTFSAICGHWHGLFTLWPYSLNSSLTWEKPLEFVYAVLSLTWCISVLPNRRGQPQQPRQPQQWRRPNNQVQLVSGSPWWQLCCSRPAWQPARWAGRACSAKLPHRAPGWTAAPPPSECWDWSCLATDSS